MDEENNNDLDLNLEDDKPKRMDQRVEKALSEKTKADEERLKAEKVAEKAKADAEAARKEAEFYKNFNTLTSKYQAAGEFQEKIREKVAKGYDMEDAAVAVLNAEGKFTPAPTAPPPRENVAGGSAPVTITNSDKSIGEMSVEEKRKALEDNIGLTL